MLKRILISLALASSLALPTPAAAACFVDYKAKKDAPLRFHYGVMKVPDAACSNRGAAARAVAARLSRQGWTLLTVLSVFGPDGLGERKPDAGKFFLRY